MRYMKKDAYDVRSIEVWTLWKAIFVYLAWNVCGLFYGDSELKQVIPYLNM